MPRVAVGVDAGGTRTVAAAEGDETPRTFTGKGANANVVGTGAAVATIAAAIERALNGDAAGTIVVGAAGAARPDIAGPMTRGLQTRFPQARLEVTHDLRIALRAAAPEGDGLVLVAGTGSAAYAEIDGERHRVGGGGYAFGDEGSGFAVGAAGLRLLRRAMERRIPGDRLTARLAEHTGARDVDDLARFAYDTGSPVAAVASAAQCVLECADAGERSAVKIVQAAALELFELVRALCRNAAAETRALPLAFAGGLLRRNNLLTYLIETRAANDFPNLIVIKSGNEPVMGALALARVLSRAGAA